MQTGTGAGGGAHRGWMTPDEAAAILEVRLDASPAEVERAYRRRARTLHPDRLTDASEERIAATSEQFSRLTLAHQVMLREIAERPVIATIEPDALPTGRWIVLGWLSVLFVSGVISYYGGALPYEAGDILLRLLPLAAVSTAFAITGRRVYYAATIALLAASVLITLALAAFGSLVALGLLLVAVVGLIVQGRQRAERLRLAGY
jgi:DnaJ-domain-containing protein 1